jgi:hypothetical protein
MMVRDVLLHCLDKAVPLGQLQMLAGFHGFLHWTNGNMYLYNDSILLVLNRIFRSRAHQTRPGTRQRIPKVELHVFPLM